MNKVYILCGTVGQHSECSAKVDWNVKAFKSEFRAHIMSNHLNLGILFYKSDNEEQYDEKELIKYLQKYDNYLNKKLIDPSFLDIYDIVYYVQEVDFNDE